MLLQKEKNTETVRKHHHNIEYTPFLVEFWAIAHTANLFNQFPSHQPTNQRQRWLPIRLPTTKQNKQEGRKEGRKANQKVCTVYLASKRFESVCVCSHRDRKNKITATTVRK